MNYNLKCYVQKMKWFAQMTEVYISSHVLKEVDLSRNQNIENS